MAIDSEHGIFKKEDSGIKNIPWNLPEDLTFFKTVTYNSVIIMGNNTFKTLNNKPLPGRINIVITTNSHEMNKNNLLFSNSLDSAIILAQSIKTKNDLIYIIGGKSVYDQIFEKFSFLLNHVYVTHVIGDYHCDKHVYFKSPLKQIYKSQEYESGSGSGLKYIFYKLSNTF